MNELRTTKLTAAKICHEISGYLSVMKFLQEDLKSLESNDDLKMLFEEIDLLSCSMDFFRNIYSSSKQKTGIYKIISNIYKLKGVSLPDLSSLFDNASNANDENFLAGVLYIVLKSCRQGESVFVEGNSSDIVITTGTSSLPSSIINAMNNDDCDEDIFNVLAKYIKTLANLEKYSINVESVLNGGLRIKIWK